jgi:N-acetyl-anhydromuramyl-L-alanine amidase AmpD
MRVSGIPYVQGRNSYADADGTKYAIAIHNTSNNATAEAEASYATRRTDGVSAHFYADADSVIQSLDTAARAGHAGNSEGNQHAVAVEIRGFNAWSRQTWLDSVAWSLLGRVLADVCRAYGIQVRRASVAEMQSNPRVRAVYSHDDMRRAWGGTDHTDPGGNFPWDRLFAAVNAAMNGGDDVEQSERVSPATPDNNSVGDALNIAVQVRTGLWLDESKTGYGPPRPSSALGKLHAKLDAALAALGVAQADIDELQARPVVDVAVLAAALAPLLADRLDVELDAAAVLGVLQSPEGQAALVQASTAGANAAEDS